MSTSKATKKSEDGRRPTLRYRTNETTDKPSVKCRNAKTGKLEKRRPSDTAYATCDGKKVWFGRVDDSATFRRFDATLARWLPSSGCSGSPVRGPPSSSA